MTALFEAPDFRELDSQMRVRGGGIGHRFICAPAGADRDVVGAFATRCSRDKPGIVWRVPAEQEPEPCPGPEHRLHWTVWRCRADG